VILDGCRFDALRKYSFPDGTVEHRWSGGSHSREFLEHNVGDRTLDDVIWVTANPWVSDYSDSIFEVINVWATGWDEKFETVQPEKMVEQAKAADEDYPDKRLVVHFMQPHYPFIGDKGRTELPQHRTFEGGGRIESSEAEDIWAQLRRGNVGKETVWEAYIENLELVLPAAEEIIDEIPGKSVLTADHGNEFGRGGFPVPIPIYGHPPKLRSKNLNKVPWVVFEDEERKQIRPGAISSTEDESVEAVAKERLRQLGYADT
jgi:hypothetical protein